MRSTGGSVDERGYYLTDKHCIVTFRFEEIEQLVIQDFNHQNALSGILFEMDGTLRVTFEGIFGVSARFRCAKAIVDAVVKARVEDLRP